MLVRLIKLSIKVHTIVIYIFIYIENGYGDHDRLRHLIFRILYFIVLVLNFNSTLFGCNDVFQFIAVELRVLPKF